MEMEKLKSRKEDGLLRTDACFERHNISREAQYDNRESESFSGEERALAREEDHLANLQSIKSRGEYIPRYNNRFTRWQAAREAEKNAEFNSLCERGE